MDAQPGLTGTGGTLEQGIRAAAARLGFEAAGITKLDASEHAAVYRDWLRAGHHGDMRWMARADAVARRTDARDSFPELRSAIVVAHHYPARADADADTPPSAGIIARYARGRDYHRVMRPRLLALLRWLEDRLGRRLEAARACVDTSPVFERELARRAGLGWFGRNTMLIHPRRGSYFFLGVLLVEVELEPDPPFAADHCGTCNACIEACPTGALLGRTPAGAPLMDARRCISYLTIEQRGPIPAALREAIGNRVFGCDICQDVCPFNRRFAAPAAEPAYAARGPGAPPTGVQPDRSTPAAHPGTEAPALLALHATASDPGAWDAFSRGSAIRRAGRTGFLRNVVVALGNWGADGAIPALTATLHDGEPLARAHAAWALGRIRSTPAHTALHERLPRETDEGVRAEILAALRDAGA